MSFLIIIIIIIIKVGEGEKGRRREGGKAEEGFGRSKETVEGSRGAGGLQPGQGDGRGGGQRGKKSGRGEGPSFPLSWSFQPMIVYFELQMGTTIILQLF